MLTLTNSMTAKKMGTNMGDGADINYSGGFLVGVSRSKKTPTVCATRLMDEMLENCSAQYVRAKTHKWRGQRISVPLPADDCKNFKLPPNSMLHGIFVTFWKEPPLYIELRDVTFSDPDGNTYSWGKDRRFNKRWRLQWEFSALLAEIRRRKES